MILRRLGNKQKIAKEIQKYFPQHNCYVEPFFGAGGMFFNKPKANYNMLNDLDSDVFNLFQVVINQKDELEGTSSPIILLKESIRENSSLSLPFSYNTLFTGKTHHLLFESDDYKIESNNIIKDPPSHIFGFEMNKKSQRSNK